MPAHGATLRLWLWRSRRLPQDPAPPYDPSAPRRFRLGALGGKPAPWLDAAVLDRLADALGYFQSEQPGDRLDVPASIEATDGGLGLRLLRTAP